MMKFKKTWILSLFVVLVFMVSAAQGQSIKIGLMAPLTGPAAPDGLSAKQSVEMAVEDINKAGGINGKKVELVIYDDQFEAKQAVAVAHRMIEGDKVVAGVSFPRAVTEAGMQRSFIWPRKSKTPVELAQKRAFPSSL